MKFTHLLRTDKLLVSIFFWLLGIGSFTLALKYFQYLNVSSAETGKNNSKSNAATSSAVGKEAMSVLPQSSNIFVGLSKKVVPSVVNISTLSTVKTPFGSGGPDDLFRKFFDDFFKRHGGGRGRPGDRIPPGDGGEDDGGGGGGATPPNLPRIPKAASLGTGFIIDSSGLIITNNHVVADADEIKITFTEASDEKPTDAEVVGRDPEIDVALIKVKSKREMIPLTFGDSDQLEVGEFVMAVGNPFGQGHSVTHGIISAKGRNAPDFPLANYLQTDAPINPGNSGGPLVNLNGDVIGINNAIDQRAQGIGFAIPVNLVKKILPQLRTKGTVARGYIGVLVNDLSPELASKLGVPAQTKGPYVTHAYPGQPADKAGLKPYDVIVEVGGKPVASAGELIAAVTSVKVSESVSVKVLRGTEYKIFNIIAAQRPGSNQFAERDKNNPKKNKKTPPVDIGMTIESLTPEMARNYGMSENEMGILVTGITPGGPANRSGLMRGDIILEVEKKKIKEIDDFFAVVKEKKGYLLRVRRGDSQSREGFLIVVLDLNEKRE